MNEPATTAGLVKVQRMRAASIRRLRDELEVWEKATGGLDPALVAKALAHAATWADRYDWPPDEIVALRAATFEASQ